MFACIRRCPATTRLPLFLYSLFPTNCSEHRGLSLLDLEEQRVVEVDAHEEHDPGAGADTADPDDLAGHVDEAELLEQMAAVGFQSLPVSANQLLDFADDLVALAS